jgi:Family of unknown function (DUF6533)
MAAAIVDAASDLMVDRYTNTAGAVVWFYDYLLTFSAEYEHIWMKRWSLVKTLYLVVRSPLSTTLLWCTRMHLSHHSVRLFVHGYSYLDPQNRYLTPPFLILVLYREW